MSDMLQVAEVFRVLGQIVRINGRRKDRAQAEIRMHLRQPEPYNKARTAPMPNRATRRARVLELRDEARRLDKSLAKKDVRDRFIFRPVLGYLGGNMENVVKSGVSHKDVVSAMKFSWLHRNDHKSKHIPQDSYLRIAKERVPDIKVTPEHIADAKARLEPDGIRPDPTFMPGPLPNHEKRI